MIDINYARLAFFKAFMRIERTYSVQQTLSSIKELISDVRKISRFYQDVFINRNKPSIISRDPTYFLDKINV